VARAEFPNRLSVSRQQDESDGDDRILISSTPINTGVPGPITGKSQGGTTITLTIGPLNVSEDLLSLS
jgi:hypothetical protein